MVAKPTVSPQQSTRGWGADESATSVGALVPMSVHSKRRRADYSPFLLIRVGVVVCTREGSGSEMLRPICRFASWLIERVQEVEEAAQMATRRDIETLAREVAELRRALHAGGATE